ncbi:Putative GTP-binding protein YdgA [Salmonella enterica subsp. enterica]|uniref:GTP-binding protein YdgA n=1 Tax=Salmonella enterica I TaxID=59201 RepID=A0A447U3R0_SALET|nr:Putative GTP-binding protein YdgA [Salmonella enterica subsp. enterica]
MKRSPLAAASSSLTPIKTVNVVSLSGEAQSGLVDAVNEYNQKVQLTFNNLKTDGTSKLASFGERVGDQKLTLE